MDTRIIHNVFSVITVPLLFAVLVVSGSCKRVGSEDIIDTRARYYAVDTHLTIDSQSFTNIQYTDNQTGYITGGLTLSKNFNYDAVLLKTQDGGVNWQILPVDSTTRQGFTSFYALTNQTLFATTSPKYGSNDPGDWFVRSSDGGITWQLISRSMPSFTKIWFLNEQEGIGVWVSGVSRTNDGGHTWFSSKTPDASLASLNSIQFTSNQIGLTTGCFYHDDRSIGGGLSNYGPVWETKDGGLSWQSIANNFACIIAQYSLSAQEIFVATIDNKLQHTVDGGTSWETLTDHFPVTDGSLYFLSTKEGFLAGENGSTSGIYHTIDGGRSWQLEYQVGTQPTQKAVYSLWFSKTNQTGYAVGRGGQIIKIVLN